MFFNTISGRISLSAIFYTGLSGGVIASALLYYHLPGSYLTTDFILLLIAGGLLLISFHAPRIFRPVIFIFFLLTGFLLFRLCYKDRQKTIMTIGNLAPALFRGTVTETDDASGKYFVYLMQINRLTAKSSTYSLQPGYYLQIRSLRKLTNLTPGTTAMVAGQAGFTSRVTNNWRNYLISKNIAATLFYNYKCALLAEPALPEKNLHKKLNLYITKVFRKYIGAPADSLSLALVTGDKTAIPPEVNENFRITGTYHMLSVSGMHAVIIIALFYSLFDLFNIKKKIALALVFAAVFPFYLFVTDFQVSIVRTYIMCLCGYLSWQFGRKAVNLYVFFFTLLLLIFFDPSLIYSISFQLSFSAVFGIFFGLKIIEKYGIKNTAANYVIISLGAQLGTAPFLLYYFKFINYLTMFYNLLVSFLSTMSLVYSIFLLALPDFFARITGDALSLLNSLIFNLLGWTAFSLDIYSVSISLSGAVIAACAVITLLAFVYYFDVRRIFKKKEKEGGGIKPAPLAAQKLSE